MGAFTMACALDAERLHGEVAPAVAALLATGERSGTLARVWQEELDAERAIQARRGAHREGQPDPELELEALGAGLGIRLDQHCELLDATLAVAGPTPAAIDAIVPSPRGACLSTTCVVSARCPMHRSQLGPTGAETFGRLVMKAVFDCCVATPPDVLLGRRGTDYELAWWYLLELGCGEPDHREADAVFLAQRDPLVGLLVALTHRGAGWGDAGGGSGEGLLGWVDATEAGALADALSAYDLSPTAPVPAASADYDPYTLEHALPAAREMVAALRDHARRCSERGLGVLLRRD